MPDDEERGPVDRGLDPALELLLSRAVRALVNQEKDNAAYTPDFQSITDLVREIRRGEVSIDDVERAIEKKTAHLASQQSVDDLENAFNETFGWLQRIVKLVKKIPNWILWIAALSSIAGIGVNDIWPIWPEIKGLLGL